MVQGGFYERRRMSPGAVGVVVLLHGAAILALVTAKEAVLQRIKPAPILVDLIKDNEDPPPRPQPREVQPQQRETLTTVRQPDVPPVPVFPIRPVDMPQTPVLTTTTGTIDVPPIIVPPTPPPPVTVKLEPARAKANLASYLSDADYPADAIRREEQGATRFRLAVGTDGHVTSCTVTGSSGSASLDLATCRLMKARARFSPARDTSGNPTTDVVSSTIVWRIPAG